MTKISLKGTTRKVKDKTKQPEKDNILPAVVYGPNSKNQPLSLNYKEFETALQQAGESTLIDLIIDEKNPVKVLVHDLQKDPVSDKYIHVDFY